VKQNITRRQQGVPPTTERFWSRDPYNGDTRWGLSGTSITAVPLSWAPVSKNVGEARDRAKLADE